MEVRTLQLGRRSLRYHLRGLNAERARLHLAHGLRPLNVERALLHSHDELSRVATEQAVRALREFLLEPSTVPAEGLVLPVTVSDGLGRWAPAVFLARLPADSWEGVHDAVVRGLAPFRTLAPDEELVWCRVADARRMTTRHSPCFVSVATGPGLSTVVYAGADAWRHAAVGNAACDRLFSAYDPRYACSRHVIVADLQFSVMPRASSGLRRMMYHALEPGDHGRIGASAAIAVAPTHSPSGDFAAVRGALRGQFPVDDSEGPIVAPWRRRRDGDTLLWRKEDVSALLRRTVLPPDDDLRRARDEQAAFFELTAAAFSAYACNARERVIFRVVGVDALAGPDLLDVDVEVRYFMRPLTVFDSHCCASNSGVRAAGAMARAWADVHAAYVPQLLRRTQFHVASEDVVLQLAEEASAALEPVMHEGLSGSVALRPAQARALSFMLAAEDGPPLMRRLTSPIEDGGVSFSAYLRGGDGVQSYGAVMLDEAIAINARRGGIVANRAGTGKTILTLALVLERPTLEGDDEDEGSPRATLVLCPASIVTQWAAEAARVAPGMRVAMMRSGQALDVAAASRTMDLVVCGFPAMLNARHEAIASVRWHRIVVDEAHLARNQGNLLGQLRTDRAWCLSGTPMGAGGSARDLNALLRFVSGYAGDATFAPSSHKNVRMINLLNDDQVAPFFDLVRKTVVRVADAGDASRATSDEVVLIPLPESAHAAYAALEAESRTDLINLASRTRDLMMRPLQRLRDWCAGATELHRRLDRPRLAPGGGGGETDALPVDAARVGVRYNAAAHGVGYNDPDSDVCTVCLEPLMYARLAMPPCRHWFCLPCVVTSVQRWARCPTCRHAATLATLRVQPEEVSEPTPPLEPHADADADAVDEEAEAEGLGPAPPAVFDAKVAGLLALAAEAGEDEKLIVFTRYTALAHRFAEALTAAGVPAVHYTRRLPERQRNANKARFASEPAAAVRAIVLDLANAEGIDGLQTARRVVFCEPFPATDGNQRSQAVSRCDRLGQERDVIVRTLAFAGTVEERLATYAPARAAPPLRRVRHYIGLEDVNV